MRPASESGHWTLYHSHKILHRDISATNILMPDNSLTSISPNKSLNGGFLIDLDYAIRRNPVSGQFMSSGAHRTGTLPYMAIDILTDPTFPHLYEHDVESFFYVLIWCGIYPTGKDEDPLVAWRKGKIHQIGLTKRDHIEDDRVWKQIIASLRQGFDNDAIRHMLCEIRDVLFFKPVAGLKEFRTPKQLLKVAMDLGEAHQKETFRRVSQAMTTAIEGLET
jgi:serine/threonine protein kinase